MTPDSSAMQAQAQSRPVEPSPGSSRPTPIFTAPLAQQLLRRIFGYFFAVAFVITAVQLVMEYRRANQRLGSNIGAMEGTFGPGIADALWRFNDDGLRGIMTGMVNLPFVVGIEVHDQHDRSYMALGTIEDAQGGSTTVTLDGRQDVHFAATSAGGLIARSFPIVHVDGSGSRVSLGRWTVFSTRDLLFKDVEGAFLIILANSLVKTLGLWLILLVVIHQAVGLPLRGLTAYLQQLDADHLSAKPFTVRGNDGNEFHVLSHVLNTLVARLGRSLDENRRLVDELRQSNATLQDRVAERTREFEHLATTDVLTGLPNRRRLTLDLERAWTRASLEKEPLSIILADIDRFKHINDLFGHQAGDRVLQDFGAILASGSAVAGRWGGEEFLVICPRQAEGEAAALAETFRMAMAALPLEGLASQTCSFGVAQQQPDETLQALLARADVALYRAKRNGRNRVARAALPDPIATA